MFDTFCFVLRLKQKRRYIHFDRNISLLHKKYCFSWEKMSFLFILVLKYIWRILSYFRIHVMYVEKIDCKWFNVTLENKFNLMETAIVGKVR